MRYEERACIVRIALDLIKADGIIDTREIDSLDVLRKKYAITREDEICAADYTLSQALKHITSADDATKHTFMQDFIQITMSDDFLCSRRSFALNGFTLDAYYRLTM